MPAALRLLSWSQLSAGLTKGPALWKPSKHPAWPGSLIVGHKALLQCHDRSTIIFVPLDTTQPQNPQLHHLHSLLSIPLSISLTWMPSAFKRAAREAAEGREHGEAGVAERSECHDCWAASTKEHAVSEAVGRRILKKKLRKLKFCLSLLLYI